MDPIDFDHTMSRDQILADLEAAPGNGLPILPGSRCLFSTFYSPTTSALLPTYLPTGLAPFHRSLGNSLSHEFRGSLSLTILVFYRDGRSRTSKDATLLPDGRGSPPCSRLDIYRVLQISETSPYSSRVPRLDENLTR